MLTLINTNRMRPPIAPIGLDYVATAARAAGISVEVLDLALVPDPEIALRDYFARCQPLLVGLTLRNVDDSFWPSAQSFVLPFVDLVEQVRKLTDAKLVVGGAGFSIFANVRTCHHLRVYFGVRGDGEGPLVALYRALESNGRVDQIPGVLSPTFDCPPDHAIRGPGLHVPTSRDAIDNAAYFGLGGQLGLETKRGCPMACWFCADALAKGTNSRLRPPGDVATEAEALLAQGVDVLHLCDCEFNIPSAHARAVCAALQRRGLGQRLRWYAYLACVPFDAELAQAMRAAGCVGINFTGPAASDTMLQSYGQRHRTPELASAITTAKAAGITVMVDLMFGGPGETPETVRQAVEFLREVGPDCVGAALGVRLYHGLPLTRQINAACPLPGNSGVHCAKLGQLDLLWPTFYISPRLGPRPAALVREIIGGDPRFFPPTDPPDPSAGSVDKGYNYNDNDPLVQAIANGARGAYWDILRQLPRGRPAAGDGQS